ncbi:MAG: diguanylate cyclase, partial [Alcanivoracaceae bacterium]|nr:diguanylate cyclase [Alcanivoracaceae bacterium]
MSKIEIIKVPDIGDVDAVEVIEVLVAVGDEIAIDDVIVTLESEKATLEVPSSSAGVIKRIIVNVGDEVAHGSDLLELEVTTNIANNEAAPAKVETPKEEPEVIEKKPEQVKHQGITQQEINRKPPPVTLQANTLAGKKANASPSIRKFARELGADINLIPGTGRKGRITKENVKAYIKGALQSGGSGRAGTAIFEVLPPPNEDFSKYIKKTFSSDKVSQHVEQLIKNKITGQLWEDYEIDPLTKCKNRLKLTHDINSDTFGLNSDDSSIYQNQFLCIDIDNFKKFLDINGLSKGDQVLIAVAEELKSVYSANSVYRFGGDEFV